MPEIDISTSLSQAERLAQQLSVALKAPQHRKQRTLLREGRALLTRCFRVTQAAHIAVKEGPSAASDPAAMSSAQSLATALTALAASLTALLTALAAGHDTLPDGWTLEAPPRRYTRRDTYPHTCPHSR